MINDIVSQVRLAGRRQVWYGALADKVGAAEGCDLLILFLKQGQKIAAFGSSYRGGAQVFKCQKRKNPLSRVLGKLNVVTLSLNWCPEEDSNFHDRKVTST